MSKLALRAQTVDIADLSLRQDLLAKNVLMTAQRNFCLGNSPARSEKYFLSITSALSVNRHIFSKISTDIALFLFNRIQRDVSFLLDNLLSCWAEEKIDERYDISLWPSIGKHKKWP